MKKRSELLSENFQFLVVKFSIYLNRRVFIMPRRYLCFRVSFVLRCCFFFIVAFVLSLSVLYLIFFRSIGNAVLRDSSI